MEVELDLKWPKALRHRSGAQRRLLGIDVFHDFDWLSVFTSQRTQFRNGQSLATFVCRNCPPDKQPALLLTLDDVEQGLRVTERFAVFVVNLPEYRAADGDAAVSYLATHLGFDLTKVEQLQSLAKSMDPALLSTFIGSSLEIGHVADWVVDDPERQAQLRTVLDESADEADPVALLSALNDLELSNADWERLAEFLRTPAADGLRQLLADEAVAGLVYACAPDRFEHAIRTDPRATDVVALAHRKAVVERFARLLRDPEVFAEARRDASGPEAVWQRLFEENPWILGVGLAGQLLTSWDDDRLEQVVSGFSIAGPGKRTDALMRTAGRVRSLVFAEIKHHQTPLISSSEYRPGCWAPSIELVGGATQLQQTVHRSVEQIGRRLPDTDDTGAETGEATWLIRPRSFLILGQLSELRGADGVHAAKYQSFELYRRNLHEPDILTFDEVLARAEWHVQLAEAEPSRS